MPSILMNLPVLAAVGLTFLSLLSTILYSLLGGAIFMIAFLLMNKFIPFSVKKEIEEDQNIALGIIIGSVMIALGIIIAAAIM